MIANVKSDTRLDESLPEVVGTEDHFRRSSPSSMPYRPSTRDSSLLRIITKLYKNRDKI